MESTSNKSAEDAIIRTEISHIYDSAMAKHGGPAVNDKFWSIFFEQLNSSINMGDCNKDGTPASNLLNFQQGNGTTGSQFRCVTFMKHQLKRLTHAIKRHMLSSGEIKRVLVARSDKGNESTYKHFDGAFYRVAYDCGYLGFLREKNRMIIQSFGKYIDPSSSRSSGASFPEKTHAITIDKETFKLMGYDRCSIIKAVCRGQDKYDYEFIIDGINHKNTGADRTNDINIKNVFVGNAKKNVNDIVSVLGKNMGDKLQVFIQFINYKINKGLAQFCVATCDEVVLSFCIMLNLPCFYTSIDEETVNGVKKVKVNEILHYDPDGANLGNALKRFIEEYRVVISAYDELIGLLKESKGNLVYMKGHELVVPMDDVLADIMIDDIMRIKKYIKEHIYQNAIVRFKYHISIGAPLVSVLQISSEIEKIKTASNEMNAFTTRVIDMYPNPVIKLKGALKGDKSQKMFNQTTGTYYNYGVNSDESNTLFEKDIVALNDVIEKVEIAKYLHFNKISLPGTNIKTNAFSEIVIKTSPGRVFRGGATMREYIVAHDISIDDISEDIDNAFDSSKICILDDGFSLVEHSTLYQQTDRKVEDSEITALEDLTITELTSGSDAEEEPDSGAELLVDFMERSDDGEQHYFNVYKNLYEELFDIYEKTHEPDDIKFAFEEYASTMESSLFKTRRYEHDILVREMMNLKNKFLIEFIKNEQIQTAEMLKIRVLKNIRELRQQPDSTTAPQVDTSSSTPFAGKSETPLVNPSLKIKLTKVERGECEKGLQKRYKINNPEYIKEIIDEVDDMDVEEIGMSITGLGSQPDWGGSRARNKTKKRVLRAKWTHKRVRNPKRKMSRHLNKRNKKRNKTR